MSFESINTLGRIYPDAANVMARGRLWYFIREPRDILNLVSQITTEYNFSVELYNALINIETGITMFQDLRVTIQDEIDFDTKLTEEIRIRSKLINLLS